MIDIVTRYGLRADPDDRYSELLPDIPEIAADLPLAFPQRAGALDALLGGANAEVPQSEDAFQVRVQAPADAAGAPVVVFVPGGGFLSGTGNARWFTSPGLVDGAGVVLITVNYRLGTLGTVGRSGDPLESQRGLRDVLQALRWTVARVADFGGDPGNVTLAGDSAGAWYAYALSTMPEAAGLFTRVALVSLPREAPLDAASYSARRATLLAELSGGQGTARDRDASALLDGPIEKVLDAQSALARAYAGKGMPLLPAAGGPVPSDLHDFAVSAPRLHVSELLLLSTSEEAAAFLYPIPEEAFSAPAVDEYLRARFADPAAAAAWLDAKRPNATPKQRLIDAITLHQFRLAHLELATAARIPVYVAAFEAQSPLPGAFSPHCFPLPFLFGDASAWSDAPMLRGIDSAEFAALTSGVQTWFAAFVRGAAGNRFDPAAPQRLVLDGGAPRLAVPAESALRVL